MASLRLRELGMPGKLTAGAMRCQGVRRAAVCAAVTVHLLHAVAGTAAGVEIHVAADAAANGTGSERAPYRTLAEARDSIRLKRAAGTLGAGDAVTVLVAPGVYRLEQTFALTAEDGGTAEVPVVYRGRIQRQARIQGGTALAAAAFHPVADEPVLGRLDPAARSHVLVCDVSALAPPGGFVAFKPAFRGAPEGPWLYADGRPMTLARWPNADAGDGGWAGFSKAVDSGLPPRDAADAAQGDARPGAFEFDDPRPARWNLDDGVWLWGYWTHDWFDEVIRVASYDAEKRVLALAAPHRYGINGGATWGSARRRFFALNALEELDAPGEWYLDRGRGLLYVYPTGAVQDSQLVLATLAEPLVVLRGARHVKLVDLAFEYGHADGIVASAAEGVELAGCEVANCAGGGIALAGTGNTVRSCDLFNLGTYGIQLDGGDRASLTPAGNLAVNNHIHHFGLFQRAYAPGVGVEGCGTVVRHNRIHDAPHNAVLYGGNEHLFELNDVSRVVLETGDAGAFYTGRDWASQGNVVRHNFIHDLGSGDAGHVNTMGVYLDDCDSGDAIFGNVFYRAGRAILIGGGRDNPVTNNLIVECPIGLHIDARGITWKGVWNNPRDKSMCLEEKAQRLGYTRAPWSGRYPRLAAIMGDSPLAPLHNPIRRNVFVDCAEKVCDFDAEVERLLDALEVADNLVVNTTGVTKGMAAPVTHAGFVNLAGSAPEPIDLGFVDRGAGDFALRADARLLRDVPGFEPIPFNAIGLFIDDHRRELPARERR